MTERPIYLLELNSYGVKETKVFGNKKGVHIYTNEYLEKHYLDFNKKMFQAYKTFIKKTKDMGEHDTWKKTVKATKIKMTKLSVIANYTGEQ